MPERQHLPEGDARRHTAKLKATLQDAITCARDGVGKVDDPKVRALFETTAEAVRGLVTALEHYEQGSEEAWQ